MRRVIRRRQMPRRAITAKPQTKPMVETPVVLPNVDPKTHFAVIIPVYNAVDYIGKCLQSLADQNYSNYTAVLIDDGSTDGTDKVIDQYKNNPKLQTHRNESNIGSSLANIITAVKLSNAGPDDVIVTLDGDDWLAGPDVLSYLNSVYSYPNVWVTYGQFQPASKSYSDYCRPIKNFDNYRNGEWVTSHLRTFRRKIWDRIQDADFRDEDGQYYKMAWDLAIMYPVLEMSGPERVRFIRKTLYIYNDLNPLNDMKKDSGRQVATADRIRRKPSYHRL